MLQVHNCEACIQTAKNWRHREFASVKKWKANKSSVAAWTCSGCALIASDLLVFNSVVLAIGGGILILYSLAHLCGGTVFIIRGSDGRVHTHRENITTTDNTYPVRQYGCHYGRDEASPIIKLQLRPFGTTTIHGEKAYLGVGSWTAYRKGLMLYIKDERGSIFGTNFLEDEAGILWLLGILETCGRMDQVYEAWEKMKESTSPQKTLPMIEHTPA